VDDAVRGYRSKGKFVTESPGFFRRALHAMVPAAFHDPVGLARRLIKTGDPAALFAMRVAALTPLAMPLDLGLLPFERARYRRAAAPQRPILLVCGSARSGTTVAAQVLIRNLRLSYLDNFMSLFPRSPLTARAVFGRFVDEAPVGYQSFYGRTAGWSSPSDSLNLWDRWLGEDRTRAPGAIAPEAQAAMSAFFGALERETDRPLLCKNNALNVSAHLVAQALPTARFVCIERSRESLALSLLMARLEIHGDPRVPYGIASPDHRAADHPIEDVCRQVLYHESMVRWQAERLGQERFMRVRFEDVCRDPRAFVTAVGQRVLGETPDFDATDPELAPFSTTPRKDTEDLLRRIRGTFSRMAGSE
jgi:sulfotransferase family protein